MREGDSLNLNHVKMVQISEKTYVNLAETAIRYIKEQSEKNRSIKMVTTSKIRNLLAMSADIYNQVVCMTGEDLSEELQGQIEYLRVRMIYEAGRDESVKVLVHVASLLELLKSIGKDRKRFILFNRYMESLVAFRKFYCKGDD